MNRSPQDPIGAGVFRRAAILAIAFLGLCHGHAAVLAADPADAPDDAALDAEFEGMLPALTRLPLPEVTKLQRVRLWFGFRWSQEDDPMDHALGGWLLEADGERFRILDDLLREREYRRGSVSVPEDQAKLAGGPIPRYETTDFVREIEAVLCMDEPVRPLRRGDLSLGRSNDALLYAWWAEQRGRRDLALCLLSEAHRRSDQEYRESRAYRDERPSLIDSLIASVGLNRWIEALDALHEGAPRPEVAERLQLYVDRLPGSEYHDRAAKLLEGLRTLMKDDDGYVPPNWEVWLRLSEKDRLGHLVHALRDLDASQTMHWASCNVFGSMERAFPADSPPESAYPGIFEYGGLSVAYRFEEIGWKAVPTLIELLDDDRPTRCLIVGRSGFRPGSRLLTYSDCAWQIIDRIVGPGVRNAIAYVDVPAPESEKTSVVEKARLWWKEADALGPIKYRLALARESTDSWDRHRSLLLILKDDPDEARDELRAIYLAEQDPDERKMLISYFGDFPRLNLVEDFAKDLAHAAPEVVIAAAEALFKQGDPRGIAAVAQQMDRLLTDAEGGGEGRGEAQPDVWSMGKGIAFLHKAGYPELMGIIERAANAPSLRDDKSSPHGFLRDDPFDGFDDDHPFGVDATILALVRKLPDDSQTRRILARLAEPVRPANRDLRYSRSIHFDGREFFDVLQRDRAAQLLSERLGEPPLFEGKEFQDPRARERQIAVMLERHGLK